MESLGAARFSQCPTLLFWHVHIRVGSSLSCSVMFPCFLLWCVWIRARSSDHESALSYCWSAHMLWRCARIFRDGGLDIWEDVTRNAFGGLPRCSFAHLIAFFFFFFPPSLGVISAYYSSLAWEIRETEWVLSGWDEGLQLPFQLRQSSWCCVVQGGPP